MSISTVSRSGFVAALLCLGLSVPPGAPAAAQRSDRAAISGVVTDNQGAAVPGASVTIRNEATGVEVVLTTNASGAYSSPPLVLGRYSVTVDLSGFKKMVSSGIVLQGGDTIRQDIALQVGDLAESVEVRGASGISETRPDVSHTVDEKYYQDLPFVTGSDVRLAESVLLMQPGYLPMRPNGDPMFRGSQFNSRINGGQAMATENFFDGAAFGYASGHQQSHESTPPVEAIQEVKVISTTYSAQYGHTSGGFIDYTSKTGTNAFRGSVYEYMSDDAFNKNTVFAERGGIKKTPIRNDNFGFTLGGPHPRRRNKTHFFTNIDYTRIRSGDDRRLRQHDAHRRVQERQLRRAAHQQPDRHRRARPADPAGARSSIRRRPGWSTTSRCATHSRATSFPANHPLRSLVASRIVPLMVGPDREGLANNVAGIGTGDQTWELNARNLMGRVDHNFTPGFKSSTSFYWNRRPSVRNCEGVDGCNYESDPESAPEKNTDYYGSGFFQRISTHHAHQQFDWVISNNLLSHSTVAWDRWFMGGNSPVGRGELAAAAVAGHRESDGRPHRLRTPARRRCASTAACSYTAIGLEGWPRFGFEKNDRWQFSSDITWVKGRHAIKTGFEFRHHNFPVQGWGAGGVAGNFNFDRLGTGGLRRVREQPEPDRRSVRVVPAGAGPDVESEHPGVHGLPRDLHRSVHQRRVQGLRQADADTRPALRLPVGPDRKGRPVLDVQSDDAEPGSGRHSRRDHLCGRRPGPLGTAEIRGRPRKMPWVPGRASLTESMTSKPFAAATGSTTRTSRSASSAVRRRRDSHRTRLRRTTPTASSRRTTWTRVPAGQDPDSAVHRSDDQSRWERRSP